MSHREIEHRLRGYELDIRFFVVLLVILMAVLNMAVSTLADRSLDQLERSEAAHLRRVGALLRDRLWSLLREDCPQFPDLPVSDRERIGAILAIWSGRIGLVRINLHDLEGRQVLPLPRPGTEQVDALARHLPLEDRRRLGSFGRITPIYLDYRGLSVRDLLIPLPHAGENALGILRVTQSATAVQGLMRLARTLTLLRAISLSVALLLSLLYVRYVLLPFRWIGDRARELLRTDGRGDDERRVGDVRFVLETFERTIQELRDKERELARLYRDSERRAGEIERYSDSILQSIPVGVIGLDWMGRITRLNPTACRLLRLPETGAEGEPIRPVTGEDSPLSEWVERGLPAGRELATVSWILERPDREIHLEVSASPLFDLEDRSIGGVALLVDVTERDRLERMVAQRKRLAELGEMSAGIAHEFRNPLQTVLGYANLMQRKLEPDHAHQCYLKEMVRVVERLDKIIRDFMSYVKPAVLVRTPVDLPKLAAEILERPPVMGWAGSCRTHIETPADLPRIAVDRGLIGQVFENLVINAYQAMEGQGELRIRLLPCPSAGSASEGVRILFEDTGPGIPAEHQDRLFSPFVTSRPDGTGLGLAITERIVVAHDGWITVQNRDQGGARFEIVLPNSPAADRDG